MPEPQSGHSGPCGHLSLSIPMPLTALIPLIDEVRQVLRRDAGADAAAASQVIEDVIQLARDYARRASAAKSWGFPKTSSPSTTRSRSTTAPSGCSATKPCGHRPRAGRDRARHVTIDWTLRENVRANLRRLVKRILRKHGYPPDKQEKATRTVLEQAEVLSTAWAA